MPVEAFAARDYFYVGGQYEQDVKNGRHYLNGHMYVEHLVPSVGVQQPYPLVLIHGGAQTGTNWLNKPDGRPGWASFFLQRGYEVYIIDAPARGRSALWEGIGAKHIIVDAETIQQRFTAAKNYKLWPQAELHTQWPGEGIMGDPVFDAYYASIAQGVSSAKHHQAAMQQAGTALLDKIGPAILLGHSQGGSHLWTITDLRPAIVKAIIAVEPLGPPFQEKLPFRLNSDKIWGLTEIPLTYSPPPSDDLVPLLMETVPSGGDEGEIETFILQKGPARKLVNLSKTPVLVVTGEASYHAQFERSTVSFLKQAGVSVEWIRLGSVGIHGNGHMMFMEKNSNEIADVLEQWIQKVVH